MHESSAEEMKLLCTALVREGHLADDSEDSEGLLDEETDAMDSEVDHRDEDELLDENGENAEDFEGAMTRLDGEEDGGDLLAEGSASFTIQILDGACRLVVPHWFRFRPVTAEGEQWLAAAEEKLESLDRLARWLTEERSQFLTTADPWDLGSDALEELKIDTCSAAEDGFAKMAGIDGSWNRHQRGAVLSWEDGSLPLSFFTGPEAKCAWAAQAFAQSCKDAGIKITAEILDRTKWITKPKEKGDRNSILDASLGGLEFHELIVRICVSAGATWDAVVEAQREKILQSFQS